MTESVGQNCAMCVLVAHWDPTTVHHIYLELPHCGAVGPLKSGTLRRYQNSAGMGPCPEVTGTNPLH